MIAKSNWPNELQESVKQLYRVFANYKADPDSIGVCPVCILEDELKALFSSPLKNLDVSTIHPFAANAVKTHGSVTDLKHFLPRICELLVDEICHVDSAEIILNTLRFAEWLKWPAKEQKAVQTFLFCWWRWILSMYPTEPVGGDTLCAIIQAEDDAGQYLEEWHRRCISEEPALHHLVNFYHRDLIVHGKQNQLELGSFWSDRKIQESQVLRWLLSDNVRDHFELARKEFAEQWKFNSEIDLILTHHGVWCKKYQ